jgi:hypothetical protein
MSTPKIESLLVTYIISIILLNLTAVSGGDGLREYAFTFFQVDMPSALYAFSTAVAFIAFAVGIASNATLSVLLHKRMNWLKRSQAAPQNTAQDAVSVPQQYAQSPEQTSPQTPPAPPNSNPQQ